MEMMLEAAEQDVADRNRRRRVDPAVPGLTPE